MTSPSSPSRTLIVLALPVIVVSVAVIYREAIASYFLNDDFQWLQEKWAFNFWHLLDLGRYNHFYRPAIQVYFYLSATALGCDATAFHVVSVALHLVNTGLLYLLVRDLTRHQMLAALAALFFAVQPGYVEAVAWVSAICDLLAATWTLLTLWLYLRFLRDRRALDYTLSLTTFTLCLLTHESSSVLLPTMAALEFAMAHLGLGVRQDQSLARTAARYTPFVVLLAGSLCATFVVTHRSYIIQEGHYALGWHIIRNVLDDVVALYVGKHKWWSYAAIVGALTATWWRGGWPVRFAIAWIVIAAMPTSLFIGGVASRYLYVPAAPFAMMIAVGVMAVRDLASSRWSPAVGAGLTAAFAIIVAARFGVFASGGSRDFRNLTRPFEHLAVAVRAARERSGSDALVLDASDVAGIKDIYVEPAARIAMCSPTVTVTVH